MRISRVLLGAPLAAVLALPAAAVSASAQTSAASGVRYVALGDSYSSGDGAGDYGTSGSCDRSANAYPQQWADVNAPASFAFAACAGATTGDVLNSQVAALSASTTLVSITIGGNDVGFAGVMETCVLGSTSSCENAVAAAEAKVASPLPADLDNVLRTIRHDAPAARIVVLDYPDLYDLSRSGGCIGLSTADRTALNQGADDLDSAVAAAAARNGDIFADVRSQFGGHEICNGPASWLHSVTWPLGESYHPNASGQELGYLPVFSSAAG